MEFATLTGMLRSGKVLWLSISTQTGLRPPMTWKVHRFGQKGWLKNALSACSASKKPTLRRMPSRGASGPMNIFPPVFRPAPEKRVFLAIWTMHRVRYPSSKKAHAHFVFWMMPKHVRRSFTYGKADKDYAKSRPTRQIQAVGSYLCFARFTFLGVSRHSPGNHRMGRDHVFSPAFLWIG